MSLNGNIVSVLLFIVFGIIFPPRALVVDGALQCDTLALKPIDSILWAACAFQYNEQQFRIREKEVQSRYCGCTDGLMVEDVDTDTTWCENNTLDCGTARCIQRNLIDQIELFGPFAFLNVSDCNQLKEQLRDYGNSNVSVETCVDDVCQEAETEFCSGIEKICVDLSSAFSFWSGSTRRGYFMKTKMVSFTAASSIEGLNKLKLALSDVLNIPASDILALFPTADGLVQIVAPFAIAKDPSQPHPTTDAELTSMIVSNHTFQKAWRASPPSYCSPYLESDSPAIVNFSISRACTMLLADPKACVDATCTCLGYLNIVDGLCSLPYGVDSTTQSHSDCFVAQVTCENSTILDEMRQQALCKDNFLSRTPQAFYDRCMRSHCTSDASLFYSESFLRQICEDVKNEATLFPGYEERKPTLPPTESPRPPNASTATNDTKAPQPPTEDTNQDGNRMDRPTPFSVSNTQAVVLVIMLTIGIVVSVAAIVSNRAKCSRRDRHFFFSSDMNFEMQTGSLTPSNIVSPYVEE